ncbi:MAG TPA: 4-alpha-glucanotransferase [Candidatus Limnocylindrales bacterium]|nr:4-alpha-glucanotransferase [Candidatus Limnocylindrales bacterium]
MFERASGVLLHPTSLPGRYGLGDLGPWAYKFVDYLAAHDQRLWQVLPLGPTSYGDSPYQALGASAGNPLLISLDRLVEQGWLTEGDLADAFFPNERVEFGNVIPYHFDRLFRAYQAFAVKAGQAARAEFEGWCAGNQFWLDDFALFMALKNAHGGRPWVEWEPELVQRQPGALAVARAQHAEAIDSVKFNQWQFFSQWSALKAYANERGILLIGDAPIFVAHDSSDVWANPGLFYLDKKGYPTVIAGVPPDYFSATGQRWGNPLYRWGEMAKDDYAWWISRLRQTLATVDMVRIDHFRGFEAYWEIPASEATAVVGQWVKGPGTDFFEAVQRQLGDLPIIAEDLGVITPGVEALRDDFGLPGMKVLQFAWGDLTGAEPFLPHNHVPNCVVYSGTHDNNTTVGWFNEEATPAMKDHLNVYLDREVREIQWELIRVGEMSVARWFVAPLQDILGLDSEARMNLPGREGGNWSWRALPADFEHDGILRLQHYTKLYGRAIEPETDEASA